MTAPTIGWEGQAERGSPPVMRFMVRLSLGLGWPVGYVLLYPITAYFYLTGRAGVAASRSFLGRVLGRSASGREVFRHLFTFANVLLDRVFFLAGRTALFRLDISGLDTLRAAIDRGRGAVLLGAHLGSFEALRAFARTSPVRVRPLMHRANAGAYTALMEALDPELAADIIEIGQSCSMLRVQESLARGELVGILADRTPGGSQTVRVPFLGEEALFPAGPFMLAAAVDAPVLLFFSLRIGPRRYRLEFAPFAERIELPRQDRVAALTPWIARFAAEVAARVATAPYNWFNFYDFWDATTHAPGSPHGSSAGIRPAPRAGARRRADAAT